MRPVLIFILSLFALQSNAQDSFDDYLPKKIKGMAKKVAYYYIDSTGKRLMSTASYNNEGLLTETKIYNRDSTSNNFTKYSYDGNGQLIEENVCIVNKKGKIVLQNKFTYTYEGNRLVSGKQLGKDGQCFRSHVYKYDSFNRKIEDFEVNEENRKIRTTFTYDTVKKNLVMTEVQRMVTNHKPSRRGKPLAEGKAIYYYNDAGETAKEEMISSLYADEHHIIHEGGCADTLGSREERYRFNKYERGFLVESATYDKDNRLVTKETYVYDYDPAGNWLRQTKNFTLYTLSCQIPVTSIIERRIEY